MRALVEGGPLGPEGQEYRTGSEDPWVGRPHDLGKGHKPRLEGCAAKADFAD